jgi:O-acetylserine/cysteine efflux transporter
MRSSRRALTRTPVLEESLQGQNAKGPSRVLVASIMTLVIILWGAGPPVTKLISAPPLVGVTIRFWIVLPLSWTACYVFGGKMNWKIIRMTLPAGIFFSLNQLFIFAALQRVTVSVVAVVMAMQPGAVLLIAGRLLGERPTKLHLLWTVVGLCGVTVVLLGGGAELQLDLFGVLLTLGALVGFTLYYVFTRRALTNPDVGMKIDPLQWMAGSTFAGAITVTLIAAIFLKPQDFTSFGGNDWWFMLLVAVGVGVISHTMMAWCHQYITASRSSLYVLAMHVIAIGIAWPLHNEPMVMLQIFGAVVVLGAVAAVVSLPAIQVRPQR